MDQKEMFNKKTAIRLNISRSPQMKSIIQISDSGSEPGSAVKPKFHSIEEDVMKKYSSIEPEDNNYLFNNREAFGSSYLR